MKEFKGTPGPWCCTPISSRISNCNRWFQLAGFKTEKSVRDVLEQEVEPNAKLIGAAPELLEALQEAQNVIETYINQIPSGDFRNEVCDVNIKSLLAINKALNHD